MVGFSQLICISHSRPQSVMLFGTGYANELSGRRVVVTHNGPLRHTKVERLATEMLCIDVAGTVCPNNRNWL